METSFEQRRHEATARRANQGREERGAATVEHAGLSLLIALVVIAGVAALGSSRADGGRDVGFAIARKLRCGAAGPGPCWRDPLTEAYGRSLAGAVRALAPAPRAVPGSGGLLLPVDFRGCRSASCAAPGSRHGLTGSNRRVTVFTAIESQAGGVRAVTYWEYRPGLGWVGEEVVVKPADLARLEGTPLLEYQVPALVPLETLPGANHFDFPAAEEPPWRWQIERR